MHIHPGSMQLNAQLNWQLGSQWIAAEMAARGVEKRKKLHAKASRWDLGLGPDSEEISFPAASGQLDSGGDLKMDASPPGSSVSGSSVPGSSESGEFHETRVSPGPPVFLELGWAELTASSGVAIDGHGLGSPVHRAYLLSSSTSPSDPNVAYFDWEVFSQARLISRVEPGPNARQSLISEWA